MRLSQANISHLSNQIAKPQYNRKLINSGIVHIGVGGFHRSHQAYYIHQLMQRYNLTNWGICGVGLREEDRKISDILGSQDLMYSLITQHPDGQLDCEIIGSLNEYILSIDFPEDVLDKMAHPDIKIVSLTITEGGYNFNPSTGEFNLDHPDVQHDLKHPDNPKTVFGYLSAALRSRLQNSIKPFTVLSCDNIQHNGDATKKMLLSFVKEQDTLLYKWIDENVRFPNSMVDRITPVTSIEIIDMLMEKHGVEDKWPVVCEPYIQWVIEDNFCNVRPPLEKLGVQFVPDVTPYEKMKIRLLNAGHSVLGIPGAIHGHKTIDECMNDQVFSLFMRQFMDKEVTPILGHIEGIDLTKYKNSLEERFSNPNLKDSVDRICSESSAKLPKFLIPTIKENLKIGGSVKYGILILAAWCYYHDKGSDESGIPLNILDHQKSLLHQAAKDTQKNWTSFLNQPEIFGDLFNNIRFVSEYTAVIKAIYQEENIKKVMSELI